MKKFTIALLSIIVLLAALVIASPSIFDELHWRWASYRGQAEDYARYLEFWPDRRHSNKAKLLYDQRSWDSARAENTVQGFEKYIREHPQGKYVSLAQERRDRRWQKSVMENTVTCPAYEALASPPRGEPQNPQEALIGTWIQIEPKDTESTQQYHSDGITTTFSTL